MRKRRGGAARVNDVNLFLNEGGECKPILKGILDALWEQSMKDPSGHASVITYHKAEDIVIEHVEQIFNQVNDLTARLRAFHLELANMICVTEGTFTLQDVRNALLRHIPYEWIMGEKEDTERGPHD
jgi:hypothetical protein